MTGYSPLEGGPAAPVDQPSIVALPVPRPYDDRDNIATKAILECTPAAVGAFIQWLVRESGWTIRQGETRRAIKPEDICILFRRMTNSGRDLSRIMCAAGKLAEWSMFSSDQKDCIAVKRRQPSAQRFVLSNGPTMN